MSSPHTCELCRETLDWAELEATVRRDGTPALVKAWHRWRRSVHESKLPSESLRRALVLLLNERVCSVTEIGEVVGGVGNAVPILARLADRGLVVSRYERGDPRTLGRGLRRFYWLTFEGTALARLLAPTRDA